MDTLIFNLTIRAKGRLGEADCVGNYYCKLFFFEDILTAFSGLVTKIRSRPQTGTDGVAGPGHQLRLCEVNLVPRFLTAGGSNNTMSTPRLKPVWWAVTRNLPPAWSEL